MPHVPISPSIHYWGTPVVLISTLNPDGTPNLAPVSSAWWLGDRCMLGLLACSATTLNLRRTGQCVLNLPSDGMAAAVNGLARTTGSPEVPELKVRLGYAHVADKFARAGLTPLASECVEPPRAAQCPVQMEAELVGVREMMGPGPGEGFIVGVEVRILRTWVEEGLRMEGYENRVDPDKWRPMIMSFQQLYGLGGGKVAGSRLAEIDEELYRG